MQLVAVQMRLNVHDYVSEARFRSKIGTLMEQVSDHLTPGEPALVTFPEDVGLPLILQGLERELAPVTSITQGIQVAVRKFMGPLAWLRLRHRLSWVPALFLHRHQTIANSYFNVFAEMARTYGVYIVAGSVVLPPYRLEHGTARWDQGYLEPRVYNSSYMFGPQGEVVGRQDKVHLIDLEQKSALDLTPGRIEQLRTFATPLGTVGIAICLDAFEDDVIEALLAQGAEILVQPSANPGPWDRDQQIDWLRSSYARAFTQRHFAYAVNPMMHGSIWDVSFFGQSSIVASTVPQGVSAGYTDLGPMPGFVRVAASCDHEEILVARIPTESA